MHKPKSFIGNRLGVLALAVTVLSALPAGSQTLNALTPDEEKAGWKLLFNGTTNSGWVHPNGTPGTFALEDNALRNAGGDICTQADYQDFEFVTDYKYSAGGNSGIFFRCRRGIDPPYYSGIEMAIQDNGRAGNLYKNGDAAVYDVKAPSVDKWTGPEKWNTVRLRVVGSRLENFHNGEKVIDLDMASAEWRDLVSKSKFTPETTWPIWGKETKGQICLQDHGSSYKVMFRNIKVLDLGAGNAVKPKAPGHGFQWKIQGQGPNRRLAVEVPEGRGLDVSILDARGKEWEARTTRGSRADIPLASLPRGLYWLRVIATGFTVERRFAVL